MFRLKCNTSACRARFRNRVRIKKRFSAPHTVMGVCVCLLAPGDQLLLVSVTRVHDRNLCTRVHDRCFKGISGDVLVLESSQFGSRYNQI